MKGIFVAMFLKSIAFILGISLSLVNCTSQEELQCEKDQILINSDEAQIIQVDAENSNGQFTVGILMEGKMLQLSFGAESNEAFLMDFKEAPHKSSKDIEVNYSTDRNMINIEAKGELSKGESEQSFKLCVKNVVVKEIERIKE